MNYLLNLNEKSKIKSRVKEEKNYDFKDKKTGEKGINDSEDEEEDLGFAQHDGSFGGDDSEFEDDEELDEDETW